MKKKVIIISSIALVILLSSFLAYYVIKNNNLKKEEERINEQKRQEFKESEEKVNSSKKQYICSLEIMSQDGYSVYIEETIAENDEGKISEYYAKTAYELFDDEAYDYMKDKLSKCVDTYQEDGYIRCNINKNDVEKSIIGGTLKYYVENLQGQGFVCEKK